MPITFTGDTQPLTTADLRTRGWAIPDGLSAGDVAAALASVRPDADHCRNQLRVLDLDLNVEDMQDWTKRDIDTAWLAAVRRDNAARREALAAIGVTAPTEAMA
jgi:hypothetical protein